MGANGHWAEINEAIARELGWRYDAGLKAWRTQRGLVRQTLPDYVGSGSYYEEIFDFCALNHVGVMVYLQPLSPGQIWISSMFSRNAVRAEADSMRLALGKAFLILRRQEFAE